MFNVSVIGAIGADCEKKTSTRDGSSFWLFRVCHNDSYKADDGSKQDHPVWVDCIINQEWPVVKYLLKGTQVFVEGRARLRVYSSPKDKCMKAGCTIEVQSVQLLSQGRGGVPSQVLDKETGEVHSVKLVGIVEEEAVRGKMLEAGDSVFICEPLGGILQRVSN